MDEQERRYDNMKKNSETIAEALNGIKDVNTVMLSEKSSKRFYKQIYRRDWEEDALFKGWLSSVRDDKYKAECTVCNKELLAHRLTLLKHASSAKHLKKFNLSKEENVTAKDKLDSGNCNRKAIKASSNHASTLVLNNSLPQLVDLNGVTVSSLSIREDKAGGIQLNHEKDFQHEMQRIQNNNTNGNANLNGVTFENAVSNIHRNSVQEKSFNESNMTASTLAENIGIIIRAESFMDISDSSGAINIKQGYISKNSTLSKTNTNISSCNADFLSDKIVNTVGDTVLDKLTTYPLQVSTRVTDYSRGNSVANLSITMYKLASGKWICVAESITDEVGRCNLFPKSESIFTNGCYKLHYDVTSYYELQNFKSYFPFIEITFFIRHPNETHHIPLMISPNGYTVYRSLDF